jgi:hypothetical protein
VGLYLLGIMVFQILRCYGILRESRIYTNLVLNSCLCKSLRASLINCCNKGAIEFIKNLIARTVFFLIFAIGKLRKKDPDKFSVHKHVTHCDSRECNN